VADRAAYQAVGLFLGEQPLIERCDRLLDEADRSFVSRQKRFDFPVQRLVARASLAHQLMPLPGIGIERGVENCLDRLKPHGIHAQSALRSSA
jgi:hypothetical protein